MSWLLKHHKQRWLAQGSGGTAKCGTDQLAAVANSTLGPNPGLSQLCTCDVKFMCPPTLLLVSWLLDMQQLVEAPSHTLCADGCLLRDKNIDLRDIFQRRSCQLHLKCNAGAEARSKFAGSQSENFPPLPKSGCSGTEAAAVLVGKLHIASLSHRLSPQAGSLKAPGKLGPEPRTQEHHRRERGRKGKPSPLN